MKAIVAAIVAVLVLYAADQRFTDGRYTGAAGQVFGQIRHSMGM
jgi:hypothetical protein